MDFSFFNMPDEVIRAICTTLIYSLWQGLLLAVFTGLMIMFTRKSSPILRYNLLVGGLVIFCCATTSTLFYQLGKENEVKVAQIATAQIVSGTDTPLLPTVNAEMVNHQLFGFLNNHYNTIVLIWFLIVLARTIQLLTGFQSLYELRRKASFNIQTDLQNNMLFLAAKMGIKQCVGIAESALVKVPMVIGHLKPLILIPVGLFVALPPSAIEAILVHELAHIRRRDYLVNLLTSLIEVIFFFNPAVLWLASLIREEREHCCDDIVVAQTSNKTNYIKALIACQEYHLAIPDYAMALSGQKKSHLLGRVRRILSKNNQSLNAIEKSLLSICLVIAGLLTITFSNAEKINNMVSNASHQVMWAGMELTSKIEQKEPVELTMPNLAQNPLLAAANGNIVVPDTAKCQIYLPNQVNDQTSLLITNGNFQTQLLKQNGILYQINSKGKNVGSLQVNGKTVPVSEHQKFTAIIDSLQSEKRALPKLSTLKERQDYLVSKQHYRADSAKKYAHLQKDYQSHKTGYEIQLPVASAISVNVPINMKVSNRTDVPEQLAEAILNDSLASSVKSFKLTESELIVNGKRIPDIAYSSFKYKNIQSIQKGTTVYYNFNTSTITN